ncbi:MAG: hypothetical protein ACYDH5_04630 [Acidimicrobiales bacterium]
MVVTVATGGNSPALACWLARRLDAVVTPCIAELARLLGAARSDLRAEGQPVEGLAWRHLVEQVAPLAYSGRMREAEEGVLSWVQERLARSERGAAGR